MNNKICPKCGSQFIAKRHNKNGGVYYVCLTCNKEIR